MMDIDNNHNNNDTKNCDSIMENFIKQNKKLLLPYEEDELRKKNHPVNIKCFGELSKEKKENFEKNKHSFKHNEFTLFTNYENNRYKFFPNDHIDFKYKIADKDKLFLGKGVFGEVIKCNNRTTYMDCAIKIIKNELKYEKAAMTEINILTDLNKNSSNQHVLKLLNFFKYRGHIFLVFNCYYKNIYEILKINKYKGFSIDLCIDYGKQIANGLNYIHSKNIVHCDLKPENILFKNDNMNEIIIIDFGLSSDENKLNEYLDTCRSKRHYMPDHFYVQSRYYRAGETVLCLSRDRNIDIWSFGTILYEMLFGKPLFPCKTNKILLNRIVEVIVYPPFYMIDKYNLSIQFIYYDESLVNRNTYLENKKKEKKLKYINHNVVANYINIIRSCIDWDFQKRIKSSELFEYMKIIQNDTEHIYNFDIENREITQIN